MITLLTKLTAWGDGLGRLVGRGVAWLLILMALLTSINVVLRYGFDINSTAAQESVMYMHAIVFMLGAAYALSQDAHVRVDIFYRRFKPRTRAWVNALGALIFLLPLCVFIFAISLDYVQASWQVREASPNGANGLPYVYLLKSLLLVFPVLFGIQAVTEVCRALLTLSRDEECSDA